MKNRKIIKVLFVVYNRYKVVFVIFRNIWNIINDFFFFLQSNYFLLY